MLKVAKFGGSSLAGAEQFRKVKQIIESDPARMCVVVSAAGKRHKKDSKITDLLYLTHAHINYGVSHEDIFSMIEQRYYGIRDEPVHQRPGHHSGVLRRRRADVLRRADPGSAGSL